MSKKYVNYDADDSISKYFKDVRKSKLITSKEEVILAKKILKGDKQALDTLVLANLKFVISIAKEYQGQGLELPDLINEGNLGLIKAANKFDHKRGYKFISYAVWWIRQSIIQSLNDNARMVRLPSNVIHKISQLNKEIAKFEHLNEREPIYGEIFDKNGGELKFISHPKCASLNEIINEDGDELGDLIGDELLEDNRIIVDARIKKELDKTISILTEREQDIIRNYYGIDTECEGMTLEAIGEKYSLTKERIRQIKLSSLRKLRYHSNGLFNVLQQ